MTRLAHLALASFALGFATPADAFEPGDMRPFSFAAVPEALAVSATAPSQALAEGARVAVARMELGRLIALPHAEAERWGDVAARTGVELAPLAPGAYLNAVPDIAFDCHDTDNKLDEVRLAAVDEGFDAVLVYGMGEDAASGFARRRAERTGWRLAPRGARSTTAIEAGAHSKAVLVEARTGRVLGARVAGRQDRHIGTLSDAVAEMLTES